MSGRVVVYGGNGALGKVVVKFFKQKNINVTSIDLVENSDADTNIIIGELGSWTGQEVEVKGKLAEALGDEKVNAVFCVAGGWAGGNSADKNYIKNCDLMWKQSVWSSTVAASLASSFLKPGGVLTLTGASPPGGVLTLTGAAPALAGTPSMIGYGMAKAAVQQLCKSLAAENGGLPDDASALCILPITLDTPMNRKWMSGADFSTWTPLEFVAELFYGWAFDGKRPESGSLLKLKTTGGRTEVTSV